MCIRDSGTVKLTIFQEASSVDSASSTAGLITNKRSIESNVLVQDGGIVVLGGLLDDKYAGNKDRVPGLSDLPLFGGLFKSESRKREKTNLMVFLRPVVIRDASGTDLIANQRYEQMRNLQLQGQPVSSTTVPINAAAVMSEAVPAPTKPAAKPAAAQ